jgi:hypothetical protein
VTPPTIAEWFSMYCESDDFIVRRTIIEYLEQYGNLKGCTIKSNEDGIIVQNINNEMIAIIATNDCRVAMKCQSFNICDPNSLPELADRVRLCIQQSFCGDLCPRAKR